MSCVFLIGMPGIGKTHWGRIWSREHHFMFVDLDDLIQQRAGADISSIVQQWGEHGFRTLESAVLQDTVHQCRNGNVIVSCGGGTPTIEQNLRLMRDSGCVVYLRGSVNLILRQLRQSAVSRPLLADLSTEALDALLEKRKIFYERAHITVPVDHAHPGTFAEILQACLNRHSYRV